MGLLEALNSGRAVQGAWADGRHLGSCLHNPAATLRWRAVRCEALTWRLPGRPQSRPLLPVLHRPGEQEDADAGDPDPAHPGRRDNGVAAHSSSWILDAPVLSRWRPVIA